MARPYIILNGVQSTSIEGLLICSTPPIRKPLQRTSIEEIDGRDGDIVTKLGYSAYDKSFNIALTKDYDIDEVISYFNSSGKVIFSNEPDKYYNYQIIDGIDFEKLIRFKTAIVNMHVQPFKYSAVEGTKIFSFNSGATVGSFNISNNGNYNSKPLITIMGTGAIDIALNGSQVLAISLGTGVNGIVIDVDGLNAYNPDNGTFLNRDVIGDYENLSLAVGKNTIAFAGNVTEISIKNYSRWV